ncbi:alpha/beta hydrolase family protein [Pseudorhodoferax sp.]|uniref:alpha/beta hydrolase family protein n=1 Tax=Pseudorhodoferax sp. TaxID=1993553 RepID=UPI002DD6870D|nr:alpha/beta hydrolase [Pseudorhodoferax sp.]
MRVPALLALPGWDDHGKQQFDALSAQLAPDGWVCRRARIPDASWPAQQRAEVSRSDSLHALLEDYMDLAGVRGIARGRLGLLGFSYGGYMATFLAAAKPVRFLALRSPALYPDAGWDEPKESLDQPSLRAYRGQRLGPAQNRSLWCCARFRGDVLLIDSEEDEIIPPAVIANYESAFRAARSMTRYTLAGADHALSAPAAQREYHNVLVDWLGSLRR